MQSYFDDNKINVLKDKSQFEIFLYSIKYLIYLHNSENIL